MDAQVPNDESYMFMISYYLINLTPFVLCVFSMRNQVNRW